MIQLFLRISCAIFRRFNAAAAVLTRLQAILKRTPGPNAGGFQKCSLASWETTRTQSRFLEGFTTEARYPEGMDEPSWLDMELPLHLELEQECAVRRLPEIEDFDDLEELTKTAIEHNFRLVWICKQCIDRVNELEQSIDELLEEGAT